MLSVSLSEGSPKRSARLGGGRRVCACNTGVDRDREFSGVDWGGAFSVDGGGALEGVASAYASVAGSFGSIDSLSHGRLGFRRAGIRTVAFFVVLIQTGGRHNTAD